MPEPERVAMIRYTIVDEPETCAGFAEPLRATLAALDDEARTQIAACDPAECVALIGQARDRVAGLDPARLQPRRGLAGLFDSRGRRLTAFRDAYGSSAAATSEMASELGAHAAALARRDQALHGLWTRTRDAIVDLDAHLAAARAWLADRAATPLEPVAAQTPEPAGAPPDAQAPENEASTPNPASDDAPIDNPPINPPSAEAPSAETVATEPETVLASDPEMNDGPIGEGPTPATATAAEYAPAPPEEPVEASTPPSDEARILEARLAELSDLRARAVATLPRLRAAQNADCRVPAALGAAREGLEAWRTDWQGLLGLGGRKPKKVRPDLAHLNEARAALADRLSAAEWDLQAAEVRRAELDARSA